MEEDSSALRIDPELAAGARVRLRLDWRTFVNLVLAVLTALGADRPVPQHVDDAHPHRHRRAHRPRPRPRRRLDRRRWHLRRGFAVAIVAIAIAGVAALLVGVLGPKAVAEARQFSEQLPETIDELETLPLVGSYVRDNRVADRVQEWVRRLPEQFTDERVAEVASALVSGIASVAIVVHPRHRCARRRAEPARAPPPPVAAVAPAAQADVVGGAMYRTLGRYFGGSITVAVMMGLFVLALGLLLGIPLVPLAALWAMLTDLIPQVGGFLGGAFLVLLASTQGVTTAMIAGVAFVLYMNLENHIIQPAIVGRSVDLTPPTTMIAAFVGGAVIGVPGALVATPLVGAAKAIYKEARGMPGPEPGGGRGPRSNGLRTTVPSASKD